MLEYGMPPFLGRYFGVISIVLLFLSLTYIARERVFNLRYQSALVFVILVAAFFRIAIGLASLSYSDNEQTVASIFFGLVIYYSLIPVGLLILASAENNRRLFFFSHVFIFLLIALNSPAGYFVIASSSDLATHQTFAVVLTFLCVAFVLANGPLASLIIIFAAMISLVLIGARSEMVILVILLLVVCGFLATIFRGLVILATVLVAFVLMLSVSPVEFNALVANVESNRFLDLFKNGAEAGSVVARAEINVRTLVELNRAPILGNFAGYEPGHYAHNMLSVWIDFGILGFALHILVFFIAAYTVLRVDARGWEKSILLAALGGVFLLEVFAKSYSYQLTALILGMIIGFEHKARTTNLIS